MSGKITVLEQMKKESKKLANAPTPLNPILVVEERIEFRRYTVTIDGLCEENLKVLKKWLESIEGIVAR